MYSEEFLRIKSPQTKISLKVLWLIFGTPKSEFSTCAVNQFNYVV